MRYHLFQKFFGKMVKIKETSFLSTREDTNFLPPLYWFMFFNSLSAVSSFYWLKRLLNFLPAYDIGFFYRTQCNMIEGKVS